jgi:hypothetical protein
MLCHTAQLLVVGIVASAIIYLNGGKNDFGYAPAILGIGAALGLSFAIVWVRDVIRRRSRLRETGGKRR